ncbi:AfsR/SARP family transcriptional regulator [Actinomadura opuntiae]|uniref:AfsR/SARP family transcriptional regulator n=1 Tax=Actinomadura sp. OS1-43 TaxID=604315 RepID=UPI00255AFD58|nr:BTAD domain-containing putative transcriptional regulator [Actinomadura sp. OS1-43]MDL4813603.1 BTAD domain-containing putative transcriptional regulator [Actinomadura sp. OS1-43]
MTAERGSEQRREHVRIVVLGRVGVERAGRRALPASGIARALLGTLVLAGLAGLSGVGDDTLKSLLWGTRETVVSDSTLAVAVFRLRRWLAEAAGTGVEVVRTTNGYALELPGAEIDAAVFRRAVADAAMLPADRRAGALERALGLWRGRALEDVSPDAVDRAAVDRLERERVEAAMEHARTVLAAGAPERALPHLAPLVRADPLDEQLLAVWIEVLASCGRQAEALEAFAEARARLHDQLGVDPGPELRDVHLRVLRQETGPAGERGGDRPPQRADQRADRRAGTGRVRPERPSQLPPAVPDFTGRGDQIDGMLALLSAGDGDAPVSVSAVAGMGGIGKTTLAVHIAHRLRDAFPDGQLFVDLRGAERDPADPAEVLGRFLRALGVDAAAVPESPGERAALYRSVLADRRILVVLDNAADETQVEPLLPGGRLSRALITSRTRLTALPGARLIELDVLTPAQAIDLLVHIVGPDRVAAEPEAAATLARMCGHLPLALRVAGARLAAKTHWSIAGFVRRMREQGRLDELTQRGLSVRTTLHLSYQGLDPGTRRLYRLLGLLDAPDFACWTAAALLGLPPAEVGELLETLVDAQLLDATGPPAVPGARPPAAGAGPADAEVPGVVRYRFHDLVRDHARELCHDEDGPDERAAALRRVAGGWLYLADRMVEMVTGGGDVPGAGGAARHPLDDATIGWSLRHPAAWMEAERLALTAAVRQAARLGESEPSWELAVRAGVLLQPVHHTDQWQQVIADALPVVRAARDLRGEAALLERTTELACARRDYDRALRSVRDALRLFEETGDPHGTALALRQLATVHRMLGRFGDAEAGGRRARELFRRAGDVAGESHAVLVIGCAQYERGAAEDAVGVLTAARDLARRARYTSVELQAVYWIGQALLALGRPGEARPLFEHIREEGTAAGSRLVGMYAAHGLGCTSFALGRTEEAERSLRLALGLAEERADPLMRARILYVLADLHWDRGDLPAARRLLERALKLATEVSVPLWRAKCLFLLGALLDVAGPGEGGPGEGGPGEGGGAPADPRREALEIFEALGVPTEAGSVAHLLW